MPTVDHTHGETGSQNMGRTRRISIFESNWRYFGPDRKGLSLQDPQLIGIVFFKFIFSESLNLTQNLHFHPIFEF